MHQSRERRHRGTDHGEWWPGNRPPHQLPRNNHRPGRSQVSITTHTRTRTHTHRHHIEGDNFRKTIRIMNNLIVATHHLQNVKNSDRPPTSIARKTLELIDLIKPAQLTNHTALRLEGNANNWCYTTLLILKEHYTTMLSKTKQELSDCLTGDWKDIFSIASKWAKRNLGRRLKQNTLDQAHKMIADLRTGRPSNRTNPPQPSTPPNPPPATPPPRAPPTSPHQNPWRTPRENRITGTTQVTQEAGTPHPPPDPQLELTQDNFPELRSPPQTTGQEHTPVPQPQRRYPARRRRQGNAQRSTGPTPQADTEGTTASRDEDQEDNRQRPPEDRERNQETTDTQEENTTTPQYPNINDPPGGRKANWTLHPERKIVILGDSNLRRIPAHTREDLQIECYPGMKLIHVGEILAKTDMTQDVSHCIIAAGINNRGQNKPGTGKKELRSALLRARETFPTASIHVPLINYSERLPTKQKLYLHALNKEIEKGNYIPKLEERDFKIDPKDKFHIHWSEETAKAMLENWLRSLN